jgi:hypothetical protein
MRDLTMRTLRARLERGDAAAAEAVAPLADAALAAPTRAAFALLEAARLADTVVTARRRRDR